MTTTELIKLLKKYELGGATDRPREVMFQINNKIVGTDDIEVVGTGDGFVTELFLSLPSAERKRGKWILDKFGQFRCSNCERVPVNRIIIDAALVYDVPAIKEYMKYCPMCGARMVNDEAD